MRLFAIRGATSVERNDAESILAATEELVREVMARNDLAAERHGAPASSRRRTTSTPSSRRSRPAGWAWTACPCCARGRSRCPGALPRVIRLLLHYHAGEGHEPAHVYLGEARALRADLDAAQ